VTSDREAIHRGAMSLSNVAARSPSARSRKRSEAGCRPINRRESRSNDSPAECRFPTESTGFRAWHRGCVATLGGFPCLRRRRLSALAETSVRERPRRRRLASSFAKRCITCGRGSTGLDRRSRRSPSDSQRRVAPASSCHGRQRDRRLARKRARSMRAAQARVGARGHRPNGLARFGGR
jgi:hypothetical protein